MRSHSIFFLRTETSGAGARRWRRVSTGAGWMAPLLPAAADDNMRPMSLQLCVQYANECSWHVKLDKPHNALRARLYCELVLELPKIKLCWLTPQPPFKSSRVEKGTAFGNWPIRHHGRLPKWEWVIVAWPTAQAGWPCNMDVGAVGCSRRSLHQSPPLGSITACRKPLIVNFHSSTEWRSAKCWAQN